MIVEVQANIAISMARIRGVGGHRRKGEPALYNEIKKLVTISLTPTGVANLDARATQLGTNRSDLIEQFARGLLDATPAPTEGELQETQTPAKAS
ncbi:hypothetical protein OSCI_1340002 [Kamptonema sp. PCC 6506]|nr:hypothetical protein [Kamptonema formosum]CBN54943.1 hypothetical protein OSCI_1340002 [Kamptonema sp. PCC 6506]